MAWEGSTRLETLPPDWPARVARVRRRAATAEHPTGQCEKRYRSAINNRWMRCTIRGDGGVDHRRDRLDHDDLQLLCSFHHTKKTQLEAQAAKVAKRNAARRPAEAHPGGRGR